MAKCHCCGKDMLRANGCIPIPFAVKHKGYVMPAKVGEMDCVQPGERCSDCGAKYGYYHHPGCDIERCPSCGYQALMCDCYYHVEVPSTVEEINEKICAAEAILENCQDQYTEFELMGLAKEKQEYEEMLTDEAFFKDGKKIAK